MVEIPTKSRSDDGIPLRNLSRYLMVALGMHGVMNLDPEEKRWRKGLEGAIAFAIKKGRKFAFERVDVRHFQEGARRAGVVNLLDDNGAVYKLKYKNSTDAVEYLEDLMSSKEIKFYEQMSGKFLNGFGASGTGPKPRSWEHPDKKEKHRLKL